MRFEEAAVVSRLVSPRMLEGRDARPKLSRVNLGRDAVTNL